MGKVKKNIVVFDFETDGLVEPQPVQIGAVVIDAMNLSTIKGAEFCSDMKPDGIDNDDYFETHTDVIKWHAKNYDVEPEAIFEKWKAAPDQKLIWTQFEEFVRRYRTSTSHWSAPVAAGKNIRNFDLPIVERLNKKYKIKNMFHPTLTCDLEDFVYYWLEYVSDPPQSASMDNLRIWFGLNTGETAHDALGDARETALLIQRFLRLHKRQAPKIPFKDSFRDKVHS
jgi:DNA polymerase III epsilon subunit-like protein